MGEPGRLQSMGLQRVRITWKKWADSQLSRLCQEEIEIMSNAITITESEAVIQNLTKNKSPVPDAFTGGFYQMFREENA